MIHDFESSHCWFAAEECSAPSGESSSKKAKIVGESSFGVVAARGSALKATDVGVGSGETPAPLLEHSEHVKEKLERRVAHKDAVLVKKDVEIERLRKHLNEKPSREMARLRLSFNGDERELGRLRKQVKELKIKVGKVPGLLASYSHKETELSTINGKYQDLLREKKKLELHNAILQCQFKESELLGTRPGACILATIADGTMQGLETVIVHGKKGTDINSITTYNLNVAKIYTDSLNALNDVSFPLLEQIEACDWSLPISRAPSGESSSKKAKSVGESSFGVVAARGSTLKATDVGHIPGIIISSVEDSTETPRQDRLEHSEHVKEKLERRVAHKDAVLVEKDVEIERLRKSLNEKPSREMARLRLSFNEDERELGRLRKHVKELKIKVGKVPGLLASYSHKKTELSTINGKYQDLLREKKKLELHNAILQRQVDGETEVKAEFARLLDAQHSRFDERLTAFDERLNKMDRETKKEFALMLRDAIHTKKWIIRQGFHYFLNKFKESKLLGTRPGACILATIADRTMQGLEAVIVHGKKGTDINFITAYNLNVAKIYMDSLNALNDVSFPLLEQIEACDEAGNSINPTSGSTSFVSGATEQFIIALSVPYVRDVGATAMGLTPVEDVGTIESDFKVLAGTVSDTVVRVTLASTPDVLASVI
nr:hypothetical protein [Tanacetum cinerariifolium]